MLNIFLFIAGVIAVFLLWVIIFDSNRFVIRKYVIESEKIRKDCRMVVLADLHNKWYGKDNQLLIDAIRDQNPDFIAIAGDLLTAKPGRKFDRAVAFLASVKEICPVFYGNGNHEHRLKLYPETYGDMALEYERELKKIGIRRLVNAYTVLKEEGIAVYGSEIDKEYYRRDNGTRMREGYLESLFGKPDRSLFTVLIAHNPDYFKSYAKWGADLTLAGHIHGGMVRIPFLGKGLVSPAIRLFPKYDGGLFSEENTDGQADMIVSRGLGMHTIPVRMFNPGELIVVDLKRREGQKNGDSGKA